MPAVAAKPPAKGLNKDRLGKTGNTGKAPAPPPKKSAAPPSGAGPVSGRRAGTATMQAPAKAPGAKPSGKSSVALPAINPNIKKAMGGPISGRRASSTASIPIPSSNGGGDKKKGSVGFSTPASSPGSPVGGKKPTFLDSPDDSSPESSINRKGSASAGGSMDLDAGPMDIDTKLMALVEGVRRSWGLIRRQSQMGSPSDAELKKMEDQTKNLEKTKLKMASDIASWGAQLSLEDPDEYLEDFTDFIDRLVMETDGKGGNLELVRTCLNHFSNDIDWKDIISERQWITNSAADGSIGFMDIFLSVPNLASTLTDDLPEILATCVYNQTCRIPMMLLLLKFDAPVIKFAEQEVFEDLVDHFNEFWEDVASQKKAIPREDRNGRLEVLSKLCVHPAIGPILKLDNEEAGGDGMNVFHRAAAEGDEEVLNLILVKHDMINNVNQQLDGFTALIQATFNDKTACVQFLLGIPGIDVKAKCAEGTALDIARLLKKSPLLIAALEKANE